MTDVIYYEEFHEAEVKDEAKQMQKLINSGAAWRLEGSVGRRAMQLIEEGLCILGPKGVRDYYGGYVPSRYEVQSGTKGSVAYGLEVRRELGISR